MTSSTAQKAPAWIALVLAAVTALSCAQSQDTGGAGGDSVGSAVEWGRLIKGSWRLTAVDCRGPGSDCRRYEAARVLRFAGNGDFFMDGSRRGTYRMEGNTCVLSSGSRTYRVTIIDIDASRMISGESFRATTEIFLKTD